ncbi:MAG TPA: hypothetical protein VJS69_09180 [Candidatus Krumholzibacteria bacterium]|nr:hypothetical protein [Candidatus Krumholzibacteria bacterium]
MKYLSECLEGTVSLQIEFVRAITLAKLMEKQLCATTTTAATPLMAAAATTTTTAVSGPFAEYRDGVCKCGISKRAIRVLRKNNSWTENEKEKGKTDKHKPAPNFNRSHDETSPRLKNALLETVGDRDANSSLLLLSFDIKL